MDPSLSGSALATLGEDLFVLSIRPRDGKLMTRGRIDFALMASELIRLAAAGRARITEGRIVAQDRTATGDAELDAALLSLAGAPFPPRPETWVGLPRRGIRTAYAARLISAVVLHLEPGRILGIPRYQVTDASRAAAARSRLDAVTRSPGPAAGLAQVALAGLASAIGLGDVLYPGRDGRPARARMAQLAREQVIAHATAGRSSVGGRVSRTGLVPGPALLPAMEEVIAASVHALTAVIEGGAVVGSDVVGTHFLGIHRTDGPGVDGHHAGPHGHDGHGDGGHSAAGGFGHH
jgi:Golgi phosphoprotein 3 (GPP34)